MPTDTVYGFAAALDRPEALARLFNMKKRSAAKAIPVLVDSTAAAALVAREFSGGMLALADRFWPGALTIVAPARAGLPDEVTVINDQGAVTVAVRVPDSKVAREIIAAAGGALAVTSANLSGDVPALSANEIPDEGSAAPDAIINAGPVRGGVPSTIVAVQEHSFEILRDGAIPAARIATALDKRAHDAGRIAPGAV